MNYYIFKNTSKIPETSMKKAFSSLPQSRKAEIDKLKLAANRELSALAYYLYKFALKRETGLDVDFVKDERGKPIIPETEYYVSLSHCKAGVACIIAKFSVGIDFEIISRIKPQIAGRICNSLEFENYEKALDKQDFLCRLWVLKEAYSKLIGMGLAYGFSQIDTLNGNFYAKKQDGEPPCYIGIACEKEILSKPSMITVSIDELF